MEGSLDTRLQPLNPASDRAAQRLAGKRAVMATFSAYPGDPRPWRTVGALLAEGMSVELICLADGKGPARESDGALTVRRVPLKHTRGGKLRYAYNYSAFILICALRMTLSLLRGRLHLAYIHNMPDVLVFSALIPKLLGTKVILDQHDPMPELMMTIYGLGEESFAVRVLGFLEKLSLRFADRVITVNEACRRIFGKRSCPPDKITVVMNVPEENIFRFVPSGQDAGGEEPRRRKFVVMYHGSLVERNGLDLAVEALAVVRAEIPDIELRVYGHETPYLQRVLERAKALGVADCVRYLGPRRLNDLPAEIRGCDVGVIPNRRNPFTDINTPTRIFEYQSQGKPVIAPRTQGITDYFDDGSLVFFESGDRDDLAAQFRFVCQQRERTAAIAARGQEVFGRHSWSQERAKLIETVAALVAPEASA